MLTSGADRIEGSSQTVGFIPDLATGTQSSADVQPMRNNIIHPRYLLKVRFTAGRLHLLATGLSSSTAIIGHGGPTTSITSFPRPETSPSKAAYNSDCWSPDNRGVAGLWTWYSPP
ncbi:hypothetical protein CSOJ01_15556 [Colletotrichum sojae]|uniref:Uncharacterized protein n=1 Tax=Colletotrichum sojae TaxID=2175907 RepID=A0A8H6MHJ2_9PEZI|nr:hypothetical protein CSOJ01_15556 [Colletotrichum sojae]